MAVSTINAKRQTGFWNSAAVKKSIAETIDRLQFREQDASWQTLRNAVIHLNRKFPRNGPPPAGLAIEEIEGSDKWRNYPRLRGCLFAFADLLIRFHQRMSKKHGKDYLDQVRTKFRHDPQANTFLAVYETYIGSRLVLVHALEQISRKGIDFKTIGGIESGYRHRDCGLEPLVELTRAIERHVNSLSANKRQAQSVAAHETKSANRRKVVVLPHQKHHIELSSNNMRCPIRGKGASFVLLLFHHKRAVSYREIWDALYPSVEYKLDKSGQPGRLRKLKSFTEERIRDHFESPTNGGEWISCVESFGYALNRKAADWVNPKDFEAIKENMLKSKRDEIARHIENECDD